MEEKPSDGKMSDKYEDKYCTSKARRRTSDSSLELDECMKSRRKKLRGHEHQHYHSRLVAETQHVGYYDRIGTSKEERVPGGKDKKMHRSYVDKYQEGTQKSACHSRDEADHHEFSFQRYCIELNKVFLRDEDLILDPEDFWKFLKNYEAVQKKVGGRKHNIESAETDTDPNALGLPSVYDKSHLVSISLTASLEQLASRLPPGSRLSHQRLSEFRDVFLLYLDFKQKEKFNKLRKLRQSQANLPIAQFKYVECVKE